MNSILTNNIEANSFMGLVTNTQKKSLRQKLARKIFVKVESKEVLMNLALATVIIVMGLTAGTVSQQKMAYAQSAPIESNSNV